MYRSPGKPKNEFSSDTAQMLESKLAKEKRERKKEKSRRRWERRRRDAEEIKEYAKAQRLSRHRNILRKRMIAKKREEVERKRVMASKRNEEIHQSGGKLKEGAVEAQEKSVANRRRGDGKQIPSRGVMKRETPEVTRPPKSAARASRAAIQKAIPEKSENRREERCRQSLRLKVREWKETQKAIREKELEESLKEMQRERLRRRAEAEKRKEERQESRRKEQEEKTMEAESVVDRQREELERSHGEGNLREVKRQLPGVLDSTSESRQIVIPPVQRCQGVAEEVPEIGSQSVGSLSVLTFHSNPFKCSGCEVVYTSSATAATAPALLPNCRHTLCLGCVKSKWRETPTNQFVIQCATCHGFTPVSQEPVIVLALIEVIKEIEDKTKLSFFGSYESIERKALSSLKCFGCAHTFSHKKRWPYVMDCGHVLCLNCVERRKSLRTFAERNDYGMCYLYKLKCMQCTSTAVFQGGLVRSPIEEVMSWLDVKKSRQINFNPHDLFSCTGCEQKTPCDRGFLCTTCSNTGGEQNVLCGYCTLNGSHKGHVIENYLPYKLQHVKDNCVVTVQSNIVEHNSKAKEVVNMQKQLMKEAEKCFSSAIDRISSFSECCKGTAVASRLIAKCEEYRFMMNNYVISSIQKNNQLLEDVLEDMDNGISVLVGVDGNGTATDEETSNMKGHRERGEDCETLQMEE